MVADEFTEVSETRPLCVFALGGGVERADLEGQMQCG